MRATKACLPRVQDESESESKTCLDIDSLSVKALKKANRNGIDLKVTTAHQRTSDARICTVQKLGLGHLRLCPHWCLPLKEQQKQKAKEPLLLEMPGKRSKKRAFGKRAEPVRWPLEPARGSLELYITILGQHQPCVIATSFGLPSLR